MRGHKYPFDDARHEYPAGIVLGTRPSMELTEIGARPTALPSLLGSPVRASSRSSPKAMAAKVPRGNR
jgi:hypothetical protein